MWTNENLTLGISGHLIKFLFFLKKEKKKRPKKEKNWEWPNPPPVGTGGGLITDDVATCPKCQIFIRPRVSPLSQLTEGPI